MSTATVLSMRAVIYTRISKDREGAGLGVDRQLEDCEQLAAAMGWNVVEVFSDNDISAYGGKRRPGYLAMCEALEDGKADAVIAWHTDRLHRSLTELESFVELCDRRKLEVRTVRTGTIDLSTPSGRMVAGMLAVAARHEVEHSIERQRRAKLQAAMDGKFRGGRRSFGFESDGMTLREEEAAAIRDATRKLLAGVSIGQCVREWNEAGLVTSFSGKKWTARDFRKVILRPRNASLVTHQGEIIGEGQWPAIVDADDYRALVALLGDPSRRNSPDVERKYLGSGLYVCGKCGARMFSATQRGGAKAKWRKIYKCSASAHLGRVAEPLDKFVTDLVIGRLSRPDAEIALGSDVTDAADLSVERVGLQARLDELAALFADGAIDGSQLRRGSEELRSRLTVLDQRLDEARAASALADLVLSGEDLRQAWKRLPVDVQSRVVDALMTVTILPAPKGRQPGGGYFSPEFIHIDWKK